MPIINVLCIVTFASSRLGKMNDMLPKSPFSSSYTAPWVVTITQRQMPRVSLLCSAGSTTRNKLPGHMHMTPLEKGKGRETNLPPHSAPLEARWSSRQLLCPGLLQNYCALELLQPPVKCPHLPLLGQSWCQTYHNELQLEVHLGRKENVYLYLMCGVKNTSETKSPLNASCLILFQLIRKAALYTSNILYTGWEWKR